MIVLKANEFEFKQLIGNNMAKLYEPLSK